jgi:hypothetical protein
LEPAVEETPFGLGRGSVESRAMALLASAARPEAAKQVGARGVQHVIVVELPGVDDRVDQLLRPASGPSDIAIATARFNSTIALGATRSSRK